MTGSESFSQLSNSTSMSNNINNNLDRNKTNSNVQPFLEEYKISLRLIFYCRYSKMVLITNLTNLSLQNNNSYQNYQMNSLANYTQTNLSLQKNNFFLELTEQF